MLSTLYEDFIQSGENWLASSLAVRLSKTSNNKRRGRHVLLPLHEIKKKFGAPIAMQILQDKKEKEQAKPPGDSCIYWMEHPEPALRGQEETWLQPKIIYLVILGCCGGYSGSRWNLCSATCWISPVFKHVQKHTVLEQQKSTLAIV